MKILRAVHHVGTFLGIVLFFLITLSLFIKEIFIVAPISMLISFYVINKYGKAFRGIGIFTHFLLSFMPVFIVNYLCKYIEMGSSWTFFITLVASISVMVAGYYIEKWQANFSKLDFAFDIIGAIYPILLISAGII